VCIHAHFYQPPRENPWIEAVEPEASAAPHHDWNARITAECYAPNGAARVLDADGRITEIRDNYASISFNFGPTLLGWLETEAPEVYASVIEGDAASMKRFGGHGSALAQPYNHMIMPLATARDRRTQVRWGIADFRRRFEREPEGMWLPETAVDIDTLEALAEHGIRFTILAPHQAGRVRAPGGDWQDVADGGPETTRSYRQVLPSGREISLFFYDGPTSTAVAFEKLLDDGGSLAARLAGLSAPGSGSEGGLVHIATDGETYGHHHAHGDMALAVALSRLDASSHTRLTNYAEHLAEHPPELEVEIRENTSWSCAHGVERWRTDCGCSTGGQEGWTQAWRAPLRDGLDLLAEHAARVFEEKGRQVLVDPWAARDAYIEVVLGGAERRSSFLDRWCASEEVEGRSTALRLLEMQRCSLLMYTSCGWFFNDLAGIETRQILRYAARAMDLAESVGAGSIREPVLARLAAAKANGPGGRDGREVLEDEARAARVTARDIAVAAAARLAAGAAVAEYTTWNVSGDWATVTGPDARSVAGAITVTDTRTLESSALRCRAVLTGADDIEVRVTDGSGGDARPGARADAHAPSLRSETLRAVAEARRPRSRAAAEDPLAAAARATLLGLARDASGGAALSRDAADELIRALDETLVAAGNAGSELPEWEFQNLWWSATRGGAFGGSVAYESVNRQLGFADREPD
jgi:alpha-amylase/alpha-mannosidase (GH57 family)